MKKIILASASPRRRALLEALGISFETLASGVPESFEGKPCDMVITNARAKRDDIADKCPSPSLVIAADTLVFLSDTPLGKPRTLEEASEMLHRLSGKTHSVITGLSLVDTATGTASEGMEETRVTFRKLTTEEIDRFIHAVKPLDRAGAYTVDGPGSLLVARYEGCYQNVLGLPIVRLDQLLRHLGTSLFTLMNAEKSRYL